MCVGFGFGGGETVGLVGAAVTVGADVRGEGLEHGTVGWDA